jgi:hypothetical protein
MEDRIIAVVCIWGSLILMSIYTNLYCQIAQMLLTIYLIITYFKLLIKNKK